MKKIILRLTLLLCLTHNNISYSFERTEANKSDTYFLAIGSCPPWIQGMTNYCANAVNNISKAFENRLSISSRNTKILLDSQATYNNVIKAFDWIKKETTKDSLVIIYFNTHGVLQPSGFDLEHKSLFEQIITRKEDNEILILWTKEAPTTIDDAIEDKSWLPATKLRILLDQISARKVVIIDACHSGAIINSFISNNSNQKEAFIFSSLPVAISQVALESKEALFTSRLVEALYNKNNLNSAFWEARRKTFLNSLHNSINGKISDSCLSHDSDDVCTQLPFKFDPYKILETVKFSN